MTKRVAAVVAVVLYSLPAGTSANDLPLVTNPNLSHFAYYFVNEKNGDHSAEVWPFTNLYIALPDNAVDLQQADWQTPFDQQLHAAHSAGKDIYLTMRDLQQGAQVITSLSIVRIAKPYWDRIKLVQVLHEQDLTPDATTAAVSQLKTLLQQEGVPYLQTGTKFGATYTSQQILTTNGILASNLDFVEIEAYVDPPGSNDSATNVAALNTYLTSAKNRVRNAGKQAVITMMAYDKNFNWLNLETLKDLQRPVYLHAYSASDANVIALLMFAYNRPGGTRAHPELKVAHYQMAERILGARDQDLDGLPDLWEAEFGATSANGDDDGDGQTNLQEYQNRTHPRGSYRRYFAEGSEGWQFDTWFGLANPHTVPVRVNMRFSRSDGTVASQFLLIPPLQSVRVYAELAGQAGIDFGTLVESDVPIGADRTMRWANTGYGGHSETGILGPSTQWYFAEGSTAWMFQLYYLIQNPNSVGATVEFTYYLPQGQPVTRTYVVPANSRYTIYANAEPGLTNTDLSCQVFSTSPVVVERAMYANNGGVMFNAGHNAAGAASPSTSWFLAEGATGPTFDSYILIANPNPTATSVQITYLLPTGQTVVLAHSVPGQSRMTIPVESQSPLLADTAFSARVVASLGVVVERAMWWPGNYTTWSEAHVSMGATSAGTRWVASDLEQAGPVWGTDSYVLIANTSSFPGSVRLTTLYPDRAPFVQDVPMAANSRYTRYVGDLPDVNGKRIAVIVESISAAGQSPQIVVERSMYWDAAGTSWAAGTNSLATKLQ